ncbi:hypothetical protein BJ986_000152 [Phycicoccus badiiscoriae]|uniref:Uncharacterized protein n=1 Tax=Pedococcus badiiscoriae TaxID=642776 RepID=A0A852WHC5_9MICO|nr:hypothetical protein [Pedococcus badiiscoriae]NYG05665.1 hypothetical protein [Pedococcus badiiscoriae]
MSTTRTHSPAPTRPGRRSASDDVAARPWAGAKREYDLLKEFVIALVVVGALVIGLAAAFSSPDEKSLTLAGWAQQAPNDFVATAAAELAGTSTSASYGPPYNATADAGQKLGPLNLQKAAGVRIPVDPANDFVITPLLTLPATATLSRALSDWKGATATEQGKWAGSYADALGKVPDGNPAKVAAGAYGPVPALTANLLSMAQSGALQPVIQGESGFYNTDYTRSTLFLADGSYLDDHATTQHLGGDQWGMMNETGSYPGQSWLWLYTFWYQVEPFKSSPNADALVWGLMALLSLGFLLVPFLPGVRSLPRWIPIHRYIWRDYYRKQATERR